MEPVHTNSVNLLPTNYLHLTDFPSSIQLDSLNEKETTFTKHGGMKLQYVEIKATNHPKSGEVVGEGEVL